MELLKRQEAAQRLRIGLRTLDRYLASGEIGHYKIGDGPRPLIRISEEQINEYLQRVLSGTRHIRITQAKRIISK